MKKLLLTGIAALFLTTGTAHAFITDENAHLFAPLWDYLTKLEQMINQSWLATAAQYDKPSAWNGIWPKPLGRYPKTTRIATPYSS